MLARLQVQRYDDGHVGVLQREGTDVTRPLPAPWTWTFSDGPADLSLRCQVCQVADVRAVLPGAELVKVLREVLGDGSRPTVDVDICAILRKQ
jgi:hypothetical protein